MKSVELVRVGYGNFVVRDRVESVLSPATAPVQRLIRRAKDEGLVVDITAGRRTRAIALLNTGNVLLMGLTPRELSRRGLPAEGQIANQSNATR
jgi:regulator of extracellular matrix RemA (YlzA/DUF370 family)